MKPEILTALRGSIKKWEDIVAGDGVDRGYTNCLLCRLVTPVVNYYPVCRECIVMDASGEQSCANTPYDDWRIHHEREHSTEITPDCIRCPDCVTLAQAELDFLRSLLPEGEGENEPD